MSGEYPVDEKGLSVSKIHDAEVTNYQTKPWWKLGGKDYSFVSVDAGYPKASTSASSSDTAISANEKLQHNVWETDEVKEVYKPIEGYEGAHRFDPNLTWTPEEESRLLTQVTTSSLIKP
jgi:hypothetical protein